MEDTPWYRHRDFARLLPVSPVVNLLEKAMKLYHEKMDEILKKNKASRQQWLPRSPAAETVTTCCPEENEPVAGQFDDEDLGRGVYDPLETPMTTPVQDEGSAMTEQQEHQPATSNQEVEDTLKPQAPHRFPTFTSPRYRKKRLLVRKNRRIHQACLNCFLGHMGLPRRLRPKPSPWTTPKTTPQMSPNWLLPSKSSLRGRPRGAVNSLSGRGRGTPLSK